MADTRQLVLAKHYSQAIGDAAEMLGIPLNESNRARLDKAIGIRDSVRADNFALAARYSASLAIQSGEMNTANNFLQLANLLEGKLVVPQQQPRDARATVA